MATALTQGHSVPLLSTEGWEETLQECWKELGEACCNALHSSLTQRQLGKQIAETVARERTRTYAHVCTHTPTNTAQHLNTFQHLPQNVREKYIFLCSPPPFIAVVNKQLAWTTGTRKERFSWHVSWLSTSLLYLYNVLYLSSPLTLTSNWIWRFPASRQLPGWSFPSPESSRNTRRVIPPGSKALPPAAAAQRPAQGEGSHPVLQLIPNQLLENNLEGGMPAVGWKHKPKHRMNRVLPLV